MIMSNFQMSISDRSRQGGNMSVDNIRKRRILLSIFHVISGT